MKKRILAMVMAAAMVVSLAACSSSKKSGGGSDTAKAGGDSYDIVYLTPSTASQFWTYVGIGIENAAKDMEDELGVKVNLTTVGPAEESQTEDYVTAFEETIAKQPDAIVTATLAIDATIPKAKEATQSGIILNFVNCGLGVGDDGANEESYNQFYYCSNDTIGEMAAQAFLDAMKAKGMETSAGTIGINTNVENEALNHRVQSFRDYMEKNAPDLTLTDTYYNGNVVETAQSNAENIISTFGKDLIGMYSGNNITGDGVCLAVKSASVSDKFVSIAVDSDDTEISALKGGTLDGIIVQDAYAQGYQCMENAIRTLKDGKNPESEKQINCPPVVITADNMDDADMQDLLDPTRLQK
ncbi:substrate-binding domain-containing protein [Hespellia stercorisuis]|uniref:Monosaccharide ABC transporter substrate-binding protein, CUT2 family (TC 3.A.1.2.-) n=1 Tax=Hespellia stercorisuis DSM 15480 TaxID=1121950 RepID=A0A1M6SLJ9_9FIRM|nr:substrate-binding domain-containing protein [Hespellia stercorisuis]SHK45602.1 monosaccharide ABC transporter substrate-binding protein, CUT2 family (TC 3.A.1.2.-) [Hespellia stercorisuis DSM 15480]